MRGWAPAFAGEGVALDPPVAALSGAPPSPAQAGGQLAAPERRVALLPSPLLLTSGTPPSPAKAGGQLAAPGRRAALLPSPAAHLWRPAFPGERRGPACRTGQAGGSKPRLPPLSPCYWREARRKRPGLVPTIRVKLVVKCFWLEKPQAVATASIGKPVVASISRARVMRRSAT